MQKVIPINQSSGDSNSKDGVDMDDLAQVRELLFGGTVREIERQRDVLQEEVNAGFAETDRQTAMQLDKLSMRLDKLQQTLERETQVREKLFVDIRKKIDETEKKLAGDSSTSLDKLANKLDAFEKQQNSTISSQREVIHQNKAQHKNELQQALEDERTRIANGLRALAAEVSGQGEK